MSTKPHHAPQSMPASGLPLELLNATVRRLKPGWRFAASDFQYLAGGYTNANYRFRYQGDLFVLRTALPAGPLAQSNAHGLGAEIQFRTRLLRHAALATTSLVAADVNDGAMITEFVDGPLLAEQPPLAEQAIAYFRHLHTQLARVPQSDHYNLGELINRWLPQPPSWLAAYLNDGTDLQLIAQGQLQCCHNDLNPYNVIVSSEHPQGWTTLDWETAKLAHPVFDAVTLHQGLAVARTDATSAVPLDLAAHDWPSLSDFCAQALMAPVSATVLRAALRSYWLREYAWAAAQIQQGSLNTAIAMQQRQAQQQLQMHL